MSLRLDHLSVDLAGRRIVTGIALAVGDQEFARLVGPNGSGKSTILKAIYRVHRPSAGRILPDGTDLLSLRPRDAARRIAVVAQETTSEFDFTVREMVMIGRTPHKRSFDRDTAADRSIVDQAIERVGCESWPSGASTRCPAAKSSSSSSPGRWPRKPTISSSTNPRTTSTSTTRSRFSKSSPGSVSPCSRRCTT